MSDDKTDKVHCDLFSSGDCKAPSIGLKGCIFYPFFELYKSQHDQNAELFRRQTLESIDHLRLQTKKVFDTLEGNGGEGLKVKVSKLETKLGVYVALGGAGAGLVAHLVVTLVQAFIKGIG